MKDKTKLIIRNFLKWGSLTCFLATVLTILIEAAIPANISADQSNDIAGVVQDELDKNHDKETIKDIDKFDIILNSTKDIYYVNEVVSYSINYVPIDTSYKNLDYEISDSSLLKIDTYKKEITFLKEGNVKLTFRSEKKKELSQTFNFVIKNIEPKSIEFVSCPATLNLNDTLTLNYKITPENTTLKDVDFVSSNTSIISVDKSGTIKALKAGCATIKIYLTSYQNIFDVQEIKVNEKHIEEASSINVQDIELYNKDNKEFFLTYSPVSSTFDASKLYFSYDDSNLSITKTKLDRSKGRFYFKVSYNTNELFSPKEIPVEISYNDLSSNFKITILPQEKLDVTLIDEDKLNLDYEVSIITSSYYPLIKNYSEEIEITIPFIDEVTKNQAKYALNEFLIETSDNLNIISSSYKMIKLGLSNVNTIHETVKYYFNKNVKDEYLTFNLTFKNLISNDHIVDIKLTKFYEDKELKLLPNETYTNIFTKTIESSSKNSPLNKTPINVTVDDSSKDLIKVNYDKNKNPISLTTLKQGEAKIHVTSRLEDSVNALKKVDKIYKIKIDEFISSSYLTFDSTELNKDSIEIDKTKRHEVNLNFKQATTFADGSSRKHPNIDIPYNVSLNNSNHLTYDNETKEIKGISNGNTKITFTPLDEKYKEFSKSLDIIVNHIDIDLNSFKFSFKETSSNEYNKVNEDFSLIPLHTSFNVSSIVNEDASNKKVRYISSNPEIVSINQISGEAKANKVGSTKLTCYSEDNPNIKISKNIDVIDTSSPFKIDKEALKANKFEEKKDENNSFSHYYIGLNYGESYKLRINPIDKNATSSKVKFTFENKKGEESDSSIISIDKEGNIETKNIGSTWVKISYGENPINTFVSYVNFDIYRQNQMPFKDMAYKLRKLIGHFGLFAFAASSGLLFILLQFKGYSLKIVIMIIYSALGVFIAFLSERIQSFIPGRGCTLKDSLLNSFGFVVITFSIIILLIILYIISKLKQTKKEKDFIKEIYKKD